MFTNRPNWEKLLAEFPSDQGDFVALPEPHWDDLSDLVKTIEPKGVERAIARFRAAGSKALFDDSVLEGFNFTLPEIKTLLEGKILGNSTQGTLEQQYQVRDLAKAAQMAVALAFRERNTEPNKLLSDRLHTVIGASLPIETVKFRGDQAIRNEGPLVSLRRSFSETFQALDARLMQAVLDRGLERISKLQHPLLRATTWAAFAAYEQFYFDGNKRSGRYVMNTVLMSHGYDAVLIPAEDLEAYQQVLVDSFKTGDLTSQITFLIEHYRD